MYIADMHWHNGEFTHQTIFICDRICENLPNFAFADNQLVNEPIEEKLHSKLNFQLLEEVSLFLCNSVNVIISFNNLHAV